MSFHPYIAFSKSNQRLTFLLIIGHLGWSFTIFGLSLAGSKIGENSLWWSVSFMILQFYVAVQLLLPVLLLEEEKRSRSFYLFWGATLLLCIWLINQLPTLTLQQPLAALKSGLLMLIATLIGTALARYVHRLWEIIPIGIAMALADLVSWMFGPTASFTKQLQQYYQNPVGPPPLIDMALIKFAVPGSNNLIPVFGFSDWIMVVFFIIVATRFGINDNLIGASGKSLARQKKFGRYLPVSVVALFFAVSLAQISGLFIPALPLVALIMFLWYAIRHLWLQHRKPSDSLST
jgi:hypothetical protein